jgi:hypothetical protein
MSIWRRLTAFTNPHYERLIRPYAGRELEDELRYPFLVGVGVGVVANCCMVQAIESGVYGESLYFTCGTGLALLLPVFLAMYTAWLTGQDCSRPDYEIMSLTALGDAQIVWGYLRAAYYRVKILVGFQAGFLLLFLATVVFFLITTALFYEFPNQPSPDEARYIRNLLLTSFALSIGLIGLSWTGSLLGIALALGLRQPTNALFTSGSIMVLIMGIWVVGMDHSLQPYRGSTSRPDLDLLVMVVMLAPYGLLALSRAVAYRFARQPLNLQ